MNRNYVKFLRDMGEDAIFSSVKACSQTQASVCQEKTEKLALISADIASCRKCDLCKSRKNVVPGYGNENSQILFIGEAPGAEEDARGLPFVGRSGKLLDKFLSSFEFTRNQFFIANVLKCRPPENRDPTPAEEEACMPFLLRQISIIQPVMIICLGRVSANALLKTDYTMAKLRENTWTFSNISLRATYHPSAILRNNSLAPTNEQDLRNAFEFCGLL